MLQDTLVALRKQINRIDKKILDLLRERFEVIKEVGKIKNTLNLNVLQDTRAEQVLAQWKHQAIESGLDPSFIGRLFENIHAESVRLQGKDGRSDE